MAENFYERLDDILDDAHAGHKRRWIVTALDDLYAGRQQAEVERLRAERERATDALSDQGRAVVDSTGDLEDGINFDSLAKNAEVTGLVDALTDVRAERDRLAEQVNNIENRVYAAFAQADESEVALDELTVAELTRIIMHAIRTGTETGR